MIDFVPSNEPLPIYEMLAGSVICKGPQQPPNTSSAILVRPSGILMPTRLKQQENASSYSAVL